MKRLLLIALALFAAPIYSQTPSVTFGLETTTNNGQSVTPRLTWSTTPAATGCTAAGATDWTGAKAATGVALLAAVTSSKTYALVCNWPGVSIVALTWAAPTTNTDGSALNDLSGYRIQYGTSAANLSNSVYQQTLATSWTSPPLSPGDWFFGVRAFNTLGLESALSNVVSKTTSAGSSVTAVPLQLTIKFPSPPTGATAN